MALVLTIILLPSSARYILLPDPEVYYAVGIGLADIAMAALIALSLPELIARARSLRAHPLGVLAAAFALLVVAAFAFHPSAQGIQTLFHLLGAAAMLVTVLDVRDERLRRLLIFGLVVMTLVQTALSTAQLAAGDLLLPFEHPPVRHYGSFIRVNGTFPDSFVLAGYALVVAALLALEAMSRPRGWILAVFAAVAIVPVGFTFSRAALLGAMLLLLALLPGALRGLPGRRVALAALVLGLTIPGIVARDGWLAREDDSDLGNSASLRVVLITQSLPLVAADPVFGVGPGNTMVALRRRQAEVPGSIELLQPPHDVPYLIALETGIPAGLVAAALIAALGLIALRRGDRGLMAYVTLIPYLALDNFPWTAAAGLPLVALWAGAVLSRAQNADLGGVLSRERATRT